MRRQEVRQPRDGASYSHPPGCSCVLRIWEVGQHSGAVSIVGKGNSGRTGGWGTLQTKECGAAELVSVRK